MPPEIRAALDKVIAADEAHKKAAADLNAALAELGNVLVAAMQRP